MTSPTFEVRRVEETGSTNSDVLVLAGAGAPEGIVLVADHQRSGRGRHGRVWTAPPGASLLVSVLLRPTVAARDLAAVTAVAGLAAADAVEATTGVVARLKWPNDLVVLVDGADRKLAGLLAESRLEGHDVDAVVVGMGLNVNWPDDLPEDIADTATSLNHLVGGDVDREAVLMAWLEAFGSRYAAVNRPGGPEAVWREWRTRSATLGREVRVELPEGVLAGTARDVTDEGRLVLDTDGGEQVLSAGDVIHLRPT